MTNIIHPRGTDSAQVIEVICTKSLIGMGTEEDPVRVIIQYWSFDGKLLAYNDEWKSEY